MMSAETEISLPLLKNKTVPKNQPDYLSVSNIVTFLLVAIILIIGCTVLGYTIGNKKTPPNIEEVELIEDN